MPKRPDPSPESRMKQLMRRAQRRGRRPNPQQTPWWDKALRWWWKIFFGFIFLTLAGNYASTYAMQGPLNPIDYLLTYSYLAHLALGSATAFWGIFGFLFLSALGGFGLNVRNWVVARRQRDILRRTYVKAAIAAYQVIPVVLDPERAHNVRLPLGVYQNQLFDRGSGAARTAGGAPQAQRKVEDIIELLGQSESKALVILGDPGSGKTTLLKYSMQAAAQRASRNPAQPLPVYCELRLLVGHIKRHPHTAIADYLLEHETAFRESVFAPIAEADRAQLAHDLNAMILDRGRGIVFLDGLDEVEYGARRDLIAWITQYLDSPEIILVIGTRYTDYDPESFAPLVLAEWIAQPMTPPIQDELAQKLLPALFADLPIDLQRRRSRPRWEQFVTNLRGRPQTAGWSGNPLYFTLAAYVFVQRDGQFPASRVELYARSIDALLSKAVQNQLDRTTVPRPEGLLFDIRRTLAEVALRFYDADAFTLADLTLPLNRAREEVHLPFDTGTMQQWVAEARIVRPRDRQGTTSGDHGQPFQFTHRTFQEYLAAVALAQRLLVGDQALRDRTWIEIRAQQRIARWFVPLRLLAGTLLDAGGIDGAALALDWLEKLKAAALNPTSPDDQALTVLGAALCDIPGITNFGPRIGADQIFAAWAAAVLRLAATGPKEQLDALQKLAVELPIEFAAPAIQPLVAALADDGEPDRQEAAARALGGMGDPVTVDPLARVFMMALAPRARLAAAQALVRLEYRDGQRPGQVIIRTALTGADPQAATIAAEALAVDPDRARDLILLALDRRDLAAVRRAGVVAAGSMSVRVPIDRIQALLQDHDAGVVSAAIQSLVRFPAAVQALGGLAQTADTFIQPLLNLPEAERIAAARILCKEWDGRDRRAEARALAVALTAGERVVWEFWELRARYEADFVRAIAALRQMAAGGAPTGAMLTIWQAIVPNSLVRRGFIAEWIQGEAVLRPPLAEVPAGPFWMGSDQRIDKDTQSHEYRHQLTLGEYQIGIYPVTVAEYACALAAQAPNVTRPWDWSDQQAKLDHPVVSVSWLDTQAYLAWLRQVTGESDWRLPTEAEWEKAARGTDGRIYPWGNTWERKRANTRDGGPGTTTPVGHYDSFGDASPYACHDMAGNVWEWCSSLYFDEPYQYDNKRENTDDHTNARVLRGGSWNLVPQFARAASRLGNRPVSLGHDWGFRAARGVGASSH